ncbi:hypothetical protein ABG067_001654 [Albugo candida]
MSLTSEAPYKQAIPLILNTYPLLLKLKFFVAVVSSTTTLPCLEPEIILRRSVTIPLSLRPKSTTMDGLWWLTIA